MDLQLVSRVLWRFRALVVGGFLLALILALLAMVNISFDGGKPTFVYRDHEQWDSVSAIFVTSKRFTPWGEVRPPQIEGVQPGAAAQGVDPAHLTSLAGLYARLATSDEVLRLTMGNDPIPGGAIQAEPLAAGKNNDGEPLPMVGLSAVAWSAPEAHALATRHVKAFKKFIEERQAASRIPANNRVVVEIVQNPQRPILIGPRKKTRSVIVFLAVMIAVVALCFVLENLRPRGPRQLQAQELPPQVSRSRTA